MKVAIVCDWLLSVGGAEKVVLELHKMYPEAPVYTSYYSQGWRERLAPAEIRIGWLQRFPWLRKFVPFLRMWWFSRLDLSAYDLVISAGGAEAKFARVRPDTVHINYCHAPTHYYWDRYEQYLKQPGLGIFNPPARLGLRLLIGPLRRLDYRAAQRPDYLIANSNFTRDQVKKYYGRDSVVIHPPVDVERFSKAVKTAEERHGYVTAGRQTPYKRFDLAVKAAKLANRPLTIIGNGPDNRRLRLLAGRKITFLTDVRSEELPEKFGQAKAFIMPGIDDFGITAVEALAAGTPVIARGGGGALDYINQSNGRFFDKSSVEELAKIMENFGNLTFDYSSISRDAQKFMAKNFRQAMADLIKRAVRS